LFLKNRPNLAVFEKNKRIFFFYFAGFGLKSKYRRKNFAYSSRPRLDAAPDPTGKPSKNRPPAPEAWLTSFPQLREPTLNRSGSSVNRP
jgi:hypothetical protein